MSTALQSALVLGLGNDLLGDDGVGIAAARALENEPCDGVAVAYTPEAGLALMEFMIGYQSALLLDAMQTGTHAPGTIVEMGPEHFRRVLAPSPHYAGLPEVIALAHRLQIAFPSRIRVLAMEVENPLEIGAGLSPAVRAALPEFVNRARGCLADFLATPAGR